MNAPKDYIDEEYTPEEVLVITSCVDSVENLRRSFILGGSILACAVMFCFCTTKASGAEIPEAKAVHCILGEAQGEGKRGIDLVASALRNRGTTQGVYGCRADLKRDMPYLKAVGLYDHAVEAWRNSAKVDLVSGATYWGSLHIDGEWIATMRRKGYTKTLEYRGHEFYKKSS